jgi:hypothetical protein
MEHVVLTNIYDRLDITAWFLIIIFNILDYFQPKLLKYNVSMEINSQEVHLMMTTCCRNMSWWTLYYVNLRQLHSF